MTYVVQIQKEKRSHFVESVTTVLLINSDFRKMKTKRGRAFEKCRKKAGRSLTFDAEVWRSRIQEHTITLTQTCSHNTEELL